MIDLKGRVALVTGGSRGVGAATARLFATAGADVAITYRERRDDAERLVSKLRADKHGAVAFQAEASDPAACRDVIEQTHRTFGRLDFYIANAGIWPAKDVAVHEMPDERWRRTLGINLDSVFFGTRAAVPVMEDGGCIVVVSSTAGQRGEPFHADYAATKGAIGAFVKSLAVEVAPRLTVNAVAPGWIDTDMSDEPYARDGGAGRAAIEAGIPLGRIATAEDVAGPILFLCSVLGRHVTGEILNVNGGAVLCG